MPRTLSHQELKERLNRDLIELAAAFPSQGTIDISQVHVTLETDRCVGYNGSKFQIYNRDDSPEFDDLVVSTNSLLNPGLHELQLAAAKRMDDLLEMVKDCYTKRARQKEDIIAVRVGIRDLITSLTAPTVREEGDN